MAAGRGKGGVGRGGGVGRFRRGQASAERGRPGCQLGAAARGEGGIAGARASRLRLPEEPPPRRNPTAAGPGLPAGAEYAGGGGRDAGGAENGVGDPLPRRG